MNFTPSIARHSWNVAIFGTMACLIGFGPWTADRANAGVYSIAKTYVGLHERKHTGKLKRSVGVNPIRTPWCGAFVGAVVKRGGGTLPAGHMRAASWAKWGKSVSLANARKGDVVVVRTRRGHHVGFFSGKSGNKVMLLGGNQSNQVKVSGYRVSSIRAIRRGGSKRISITNDRNRGKTSTFTHRVKLQQKQDRQFATAKMFLAGNLGAGMRAVQCIGDDGKRCTSSYQNDRGGSEGR